VLKFSTWCKITLPLLGIWSTSWILRAATIPWRRASRWHLPPIAFPRLGICYRPMLQLWTYLRASTALKMVMLGISKRLSRFVAASLVTTLSCHLRLDRGTFWMELERQWEAKPTPPPTRAPNNVMMLSVLWRTKQGRRWRSKYFEYSSNIYCTSDLCSVKGFSTNSTGSLRRRWWLGLLWASYSWATWKP